jgi:hypothetical protein
MLSKKEKFSRPDEVVPLCPKSEIHSDTKNRLCEVKKDNSEKNNDSLKESLYLFLSNSNSYPLLD